MAGKTYNIIGAYEVVVNSDRCLSILADGKEVYAGYPTNPEWIAAAIIQASETGNVSRSLNAYQYKGHELFKSVVAGWR